MTIIAAADGSAIGNPGPAGWGWIVDENTWACGGWARGTNNQGELTAVLDLLRQTAHVDEPLHVLCDSQYVINSITKWMAGWKRKGWKKRDGKPVLNVEIMKALDAAITGRSVTFEWVRGHAGHELNEMADRLANSASSAFAKGDGDSLDTGPGYPGAVDSAAGPDPSSPPPARGNTAESADAVASAVRTTEVGTSPRADTPLVRDHTSDSVEPDLFSLASDAEEVWALEQRVREARRAHDDGVLRDLLHPEHFEILPGGPDAGRVDAGEAELIDTRQLTPNQLLLLWRVGDTVSGSSLWLRERGDWRRYFSQTTHTVTELG